MNLQMEIIIFTFVKMFIEKRMIFNVNDETYNVTQCSNYHSRDEHWAENLDLKYAKRMNFFGKSFK